MKSTLLATLLATVLSQSLWAEQAPPRPTPPAGKGKSEVSEAEILKVYAADDQGARFRAYVITYNGKEVVLSDDLAVTDKKVGDKVKFMVHRHESAVGAKKINTMVFKIMDFEAFKK